MHKRCRGIRSRLNQNGTFKCWRCASQESDKLGECLEQQITLSVVGSFYLGGTIGASKGTVKSVFFKKKKQQINKV